MVIANASGCSSVWSGTCTTSPWVIDGKGRGTSWARSLFEDNAEYGFGMFTANRTRRNKLIFDVDWCTKNAKDLPSELTKVFNLWL